MDNEADVRYKRQPKQKSLNEEELNTLSRQELIETIQKLEAHNSQLKKILQKRVGEENSTHNERKRKFNFENCIKRHVLLKLYYLGWDCQGYTTQEDTTNTIEYYLFHALEKCCLIENRQTSNYHRCGRTDKGVSAFCQVISIDLRSRLDNPTLENCDNELPYLTMLNRLLPDHIKCYAWAHVDSNVSARFDCSSRAYHYYFPKGGLDISLMQEAAKQLIGEHDFRNLCKMDVGNGVVKFVRSITNVEIKPCSSGSEESDYKMYKLIITGNGFLWHQIRCVMAILILIGQGKESIDIIPELLDVTKNPNKPQYKMADHLPLTLFAINYEKIDLKWIVQDTTLQIILEKLQKEWAQNAIKSTMIREMIDELSKLTPDPPDVKYQADHLIGVKVPKIHKPLLTREKCESLENRIEHFVKRRKLIKKTENDGT